MRAIARRLARLESAAARMVVAEVPAAEVPVPVVPRQGELAAVASHLAQSLRDAVEGYTKMYKLAPQEAAANATAPCPNAAEQVRSVPLEMASWSDLETLYRSNPATALEGWIQMREAAQEELASGARAAGAILPLGASPWWLARFFALRDELAGGRQPRNGTEQVLIDQAAQAHTLMLAWQEELIARTALANVGSRRDVQMEQVRLDEAQAIDQAMGMIERFHAMFLRTMKTLQDIRRVSPRVVVRRAGQVNVGGQQINVAARRG